VQKTYTYIINRLWQYKTMDDILMLTGISDGLKIKLTRIAQGLRQIDLASAAHVDTIDITRLEKGRYVMPTRRLRILRVLGMAAEDENNGG